MWPVYFVRLAQRDHQNVSGFSICSRLICHIYLNFSSKTIGVCISYGNHAFMPSKFQEDSIFFSCDTIYWTIGLKPIFHSIYNGSMRIISSKDFTPELQLTIIEKYNVSVLSNTPFVMGACLKSDLIHKVNLSSVKKIIFYGGKLPKTLAIDIKHYFPNADVQSLYGMTEMGRISTGIVDIHANGNVGQLYYGCAVKIVDEDGKRCGPNVNGEICVKIKHQFLGYFDDSNATVAAIDQDGYFQTGDIGHFDDDANLFVVNRKKDVMNVFYFENVLLPSEIEQCLIEIPDVKEACVVGIPLAYDACLPAALVIQNPNSNLCRSRVFDTVAGK